MDFFSYKYPLLCMTEICQDHYQVTWPVVPQREWKNVRHFPLGSTQPPCQSRHAAILIIAFELRNLKPDAVIIFYIPKIC